MYRLPNQFDPKALNVVSAAGGGSTTTTCSCCVITLGASAIITATVFGGIKPVVVEAAARADDVPAPPAEALLSDATAPDAAAPDAAAPDAAAPDAAAPDASGVAGEFDSGARTSARPAPVRYPGGGSGWAALGLFTFPIAIMVGIIVAVTTESPGLGISLGLAALIGLFAYVYEQTQGDAAKGAIYGIFALVLFGVAFALELSLWFGKFF